MMTPLELMRLVKEMRDSQKRWPDHPQQASIETMALERRVDEALDQWADHIRAFEPVSDIDAAMVGCGR